MKVYFGGTFEEECHAFIDTMVTNDEMVVMLQNLVSSMEKRYYNKKLTNYISKMVQ